MRATSDSIVPRAGYGLFSGTPVKPVLLLIWMVFLVPVALAAGQAQATGASGVSSMDIQKTVSDGHRQFAATKSLARNALVAGEYQAAYLELRPLVSQARNDSEFLGLLALAALRVGNAREAVLLYERLIALEPDVGRWRAGLALARERIG